MYAVNKCCIILLKDNVFMALRHWTMTKVVDETDIERTHQELNNILDNYQRLFEYYKRVDSSINHCRSMTDVEIDNAGIVQY
jgi:hypothetical protein